MDGGGHGVGRPVPLPVQAGMTPAAAAAEPRARQGGEPDENPVRRRTSGTDDALGDALVVEVGDRYRAAARPAPW
jgi:hypothetical protein